MKTPPTNQRASRNFSSPWSKPATLVALLAAGLGIPVPQSSSATPEQLGYHQIQTDATGKLLPWYSPDPGEAYHHAILSVWEFWKNMKSCPNGVKYYLQHQVWDDPNEDPRALGGDQLAMALSSWGLLYAYTGDRSVVENMQYIADYYIGHGLSKPTVVWSNLFYPYNLELHSGVYDGDMRGGKGVLQTDKAASFAAELVVLYKLTGEPRYLQAAVGVADTLAQKITPGNTEHPPWPFRVNAETGEVKFWYTANFTGALRLFDDLIALRSGNAVDYAKAKEVLSAWLKNYPVKNQRWGPFFEDVGDWSDTEINADTMANYILEHPEWDANWRADSFAILNWSRAMFGHDGWLKYGVRPTKEQTVYPVPANSHTSRHASVELLYAEKTGDTALRAEAIRALSWATYMVAEDGRNCFPYDMVWLTDGYGDYVRHFLRAMAAAPEVAPRNQNHLLRTTSVVKSIHYAPDSMAYSTYDNAARELLRVAFAPTALTAGSQRLLRLKEVSELDRQEGYTFNAPGDAPGVLRVRHDRSGNIEITGARVNQRPQATSQTVRVPQNTSVEIELTVADDGLPAGGQLAYTLTGPYSGKVSGTAPRLTYQPAEDFLGTDLLCFRVQDGELESDTAQITLQVIRPNLAQLPDARPFTSEDPQTGATGVFALSALADGDLATSVNATADRVGPREVSVGVTWTTTQAVRQLIFREGTANEPGNGCFNQSPRLQVTTDGSQWKDAVGASLSPAYLENTSSGPQDFVFTLATTANLRGTRVTGGVGKPDQSASTVLRVRELEVYAAAPSSRPPEIDSYNPQNLTVFDGGQAVFAARPTRVAFVTYQWQRSPDKGKSWETIPAANFSFYQTPPARYPGDNGMLYRCLVANGTLPDSLSKEATLTVLPRKPVGGPQPQ